MTSENVFPKTLSPWEQFKNPRMAKENVVGPLITIPSHTKLGPFLLHRSLLAGKPQAGHPGPCWCSLLQCEGALTITHQAGVRLVPVIISGKWLHEQGQRELL